METGEGTRPKETIVRDDNAWLGGVFEAGGSIGFVNLGNRKPKIPAITYGDNDESRVQSISNILGYGKYVRDRNNWKLRITGKKVLPIVAGFRDFVPSRQIVIQAYDTGDQTLTSRDRSEVNAQTYGELVRNPDFVAGVLDARGIWIKEKKQAGFRQMLALVTRNKALIEALAYEYGGTVTPNKTEKTPSGKEPNSFIWTLRRMDRMERLMEFTKSYLRFPDKIKLRGPFLTYGEPQRVT